MISIQHVPLAQLLGSQLDCLLQDHWREIALYQDRIPLEPDFERYRALEQDGSLVCLATRDGEQLIGYAVWILSPHLHYRGCLLAMNDVIYLRPAFRSGSTAGIRMIRASERRLRELGAHRIVWHVKPSNDWRPILERLGYSLEEYVLGKLITEGR